MLDTLCVSIGIEMGIVGDGPAYECVCNASFAVLGGLDPWPVWPDLSARHTPRMAEKMGNIFETYAGSLALNSAWHELRRLGVCLAGLEYFDKLDPDDRQRVAAIDHYRSFCLMPSGISSEFCDPGP